MTQVVVIEAVALALLGVLVCGLLRSHGEILRRLHELGAGIEPDDSSASPVGIGRHRPAATAGSSAGSAAVDLVGTTLTDESIKVGVVGARQGSLLAFLSSGCAACGAFWDGLRAERLPLPPGARLLVVTQDAAHESGSSIRELAPADAPVVMSSQAWHDYGVPGAPYFVYVDGPSGRVVGQGAAQTWEQVASLWSRAIADEAGARPAPGAAVDDPVGEARADRDLLEAGIHPGHPTLYPGPAGDHRTEA